MLAVNMPMLVLGHLIKLAYFGKKGLAASYIKGIRQGIRKCADNPDRRLPFRKEKLACYLRLQLDLAVNCFRRITG